MGHSDWIHLEFQKIVKQTASAMLIVFDGEEKWVPNSVIADPDDYDEGDQCGEVSIKEWWCEKEGLMP